MSHIRILSDEAWSIWKINETNKILLVSEDDQRVKIETVVFDESFVEPTVKSLSITGGLTRLSKNSYLTDACQEALNGYLAIFDLSMDDVECLSDAFFSPSPASPDTQLRG